MNKEITEETVNKYKRCNLINNKTNSSFCIVYHIKKFYIYQSAKSTGKPALLVGVWRFYIFLKKHSLAINFHFK